jgi:hypothetical protein
MPTFQQDYAIRTPSPKHYPTTRPTPTDLSENVPRPKK